MAHIKNTSILAYLVTLQKFRSLDVKFSGVLIKSGMQNSVLKTNSDWAGFHGITGTYKYIVSNQSINLQAAIIRAPLQAAIIVHPLKVHKLLVP